MLYHHDAPQLSIGEIIAAAMRFRERSGVVYRPGALDRIKEAVRPSIVAAMEAAIRAEEDGAEQDNG